MNKAKRKKTNYWNHFDVAAWLQMHSRYIVFLCVLAFLAIMNSHLGEQKIRKIAYLKSEVQELNWKYLSIKADWMNKSSLSNLESALDGQAVGKEGEKPLIIVAENTKK